MMSSPVSTTVYYERDPAGRLLVLTNGTAVYYYGQDGHGSVNNLTTTSGAVVNRYHYDPYGNSTFRSENAGIANPWQYAGGNYDAESGLYLLGVRYYSPGLGRFLQQDPAGGGGSSQYAYAGSDPCNNSDPSGMLTCYHRINKDAALQESTDIEHDTNMTSHDAAEPSRSVHSLAQEPPTAVGW